MIHTNLPRTCVVFLLLCELTRSANYGSKKFDSHHAHKWPTVLVRKVTGKPRNFEANLCGSLYSTFKSSFWPYAFYNKWSQTLFKDQLDRSKATCSFNHCFVLRMGRKSRWSHVLCNACKTTQCTNQKEKGFALVFLVVAAVAPCIDPYKVLTNWFSEFITVISYLSESLYKLSALSTLFGRFVRCIRLWYYYY